MPTPSALEFQRKFGRSQHEARRAPTLPQSRIKPTDHRQAASPNRNLRQHRLAGLSTQTYDNGANRSERDPTTRHHTRFAIRLLIA